MLGELDVACASSGLGIVLALRRGLPIELDVLVLAMGLGVTKSMRAGEARPSDCRLSLPKGFGVRVGEPRPEEAREGESSREGDRLGEGTVEALDEGLLLNVLAALRKRSAVMPAYLLALEPAENLSAGGGGGIEASLDWRGRADGVA